MSRATSGCRQCSPKRRGRPTPIPPETCRRRRAAGNGAAGELRERAASWLAEHGRLDEALECHADGAPASARSFLRRSGPALIRGGAAARVIEVLRRHGPAGDPELDAVLAEALQATGDWDAAIELFGRVERALGAQSRPASVAWRYGLLLYLRGHSGEAAATLSAAHDPDALGADDAMVSACLSTTLWSQGQVDGATELAGIALHQAGASRDTCALAAAHVALALVAASRGERERNEHEYRLALAAARDGGDRVQLARIHANLSSRALENGEYPLAITEAELALETGVGHRFFSALALTNKAEAHMRLGQLDESRVAIADAEAICAALGTLLASIPQVLYGELYRLRGDLVRARGAFERARALAAEADDVHTLVAAQAGLARVLAEEDIGAARAVAADAVAQASSLERAIALCAAAEVELRARDGTAAGRLARAGGERGAGHRRPGGARRVAGAAGRRERRRRPVPVPVRDRSVGGRRQSRRCRPRPARPGPAHRGPRRRGRHPARAGRPGDRRRRRRTWPARRGRPGGPGRSRSSRSAGSRYCTRASRCRWPPGSRAKPGIC